MRCPVFIGSAFVAQYPTGGGNFWVPLQYLLGLRDLGIEAYWLELLWAHGDVARGRERLATFRRQVEALGVAEWVAVLFFPDGSIDHPPGQAEYHGMRADDLRARARDGLLLNIANSVGAWLRSGFARTALLDVDPGPFQIWAREHDLGVGSHDAYLTIGRNLGAPDSPVPLGSVPWRKVWPPVHLAAWPDRGSMPAARYTTVTQWWTTGCAVLHGEIYDCHKRPGFVEAVDLPRRVRVELELAANLHPGETEDRALLARHGWRLVDPAVVAGTPEAYRRYVQASRGEFSCAKPAYVKARSGWVSDRTICYLASGRPCVVEATGAEKHLPQSAGLRFFRSLEEAAAGLAAIEADYAGASRAARRLAEEIFSTRVVLPALLDAVRA